MEVELSKIFDPTSILQAIVASALFALGFWAIKRIVSWLVDLASLFSINKRREALLLRKIQISVNRSTSSDLYKIGTATVCIYTALNRFFTACVYLVFGFIANIFLPIVSWIPFSISIVYLFLAMRAVVSDTSPVSKTDEEIDTEVAEIEGKINKLDEQERTAKVGKRA